MEKIISGFDDLLEKISRYGIIISLYLILGFAVLGIVLRWLGSSLMWLEPLTRHVVFLSAFLGGSLATSKGVHIKVDILTHVVERTNSKILKWMHKNLVAIFCCVTCLMLTKSGWDFFLVEREFGTEAFLGIHSSYLVLIIPLGMGLIAIRFLNQLLLGLFDGESLERHRI